MSEVLDARAEVLKLARLLDLKPDELSYLTGLPYRIGALELVADKATRRFFPNRGDVGTLCRDHCFANGLVMRAVRDTMIISPPLVMERAQIDELIEKAWRCLDLTAREIATT